MSVRRALVQIAGEFQELPQGDTLAGASGGGVSTATGTVNFGLVTTDSATLVLSAAWVTVSSNIFLSVRGFAPDHPPEDDDVWVEGVTACVTTIIPATSFTVVVTASNGTWGRYTINAIGV